MHAWMIGDILATWEDDEIAETITIDGITVSAHVFHRDKEFDGLTTEFHVIASAAPSIHKKSVIIHANEEYEALQPHKDESGMILIVPAQSRERRNVL